MYLINFNFCRAYAQCLENEYIDTITKLVRGSCPKQPESHECGYYVLRYIYDLVNAPNLAEVIKKKVCYILNSFLLKKN